MTFPVQADQTGLTSKTAPEIHIGACPRSSFPPSHRASSMKETMSKEAAARVVKTSHFLTDSATEVQPAYQQHSPYHHLSSLLYKHLHSLTMSNTASNKMSTTASNSVCTALLKRWTDNHDSLGGPTDFHSLQHYLELYVLAKKSNMEELQNKGARIRYHP